ncbi:MAG: hypothetical protein LBU32_22705 [Clostridiales bacterium]|nr:hypothetical protein [Clostridiales bacterium]
MGLSGSQKQRASFARALLKDAPIVVLDEMTGSVDPVNEMKIQMEVGKLAKNRMVLVIARHLRTIRSDDQILGVDSGAIAKYGVHTDLSAMGRLYSRLWQSQEIANGWNIA